MQITVCGTLREEKDGITLAEILKKYTPYGDEATICVHNGNAHKSIDIAEDIPVKEGDTIEIVPLIIGG